MVRGIVLIVGAVILGVLLLRSTDRTPAYVKTNAAAPATTTTTAKKTGSSTTVATTATTAAARAHDPSQVAILVANGSGVKGAAAKVAQTLAASNYVLKPSTNTTSPASSSVVYFAPGFDPDANAIARLLTPQPAVKPLPATLPVADLAKANILVVVAADLAGR